MKKIIIDATEATNPQRRGIGIQMRSWLETAPFADYIGLQFVLVSKALPDQDLLHINAPNVEVIAQDQPSEEAFIDYLYSLNGDLLFFPQASQKYVRESPAKIVGIDYGMEDFYCRNYIAPRPVSELMQGHEFAMEYYTGIVTVSETSRRDLAWFFPEYKDKVEVIYPGSGPGQVVPAQSLPEELQDAPYFFIIGYEHKKNIARIADAFDLFKKRTGSHTKLAIAGKPGFGGTEIDSHVSKLASVHDIVRLGYISNSQKQLLLERCRALVALPIYEGFGISALEGMEAGKVVLVSDNGSLKEVIGNAGYTADPFSIASMEERFVLIDGLKDNPKKQYIQERLAIFDRPAQAKKFLDYLHRIIAQ